MKTLLLAAILAALSLPAAAQEEETKDPIDVAMQTCLDTPANQATYGMIDCADQAYDAWDKELNTAYSALLQDMDADSAARLKDAQRKWVAFRDAEFHFQGGAWINDQGSLMLVILALDRVEIIRARVKTLRSHLTGS